MEINLSKLIEIQQQLQIFHWQCSSFAQHSAFGSTYDSFGGLLDNFVECYMGQYKQATGLSKTYNVLLKGYSEQTANEFLFETLQFLRKDLVVNDSHKDLAAIRDEMVGCITKLAYLLRLK